MTSRASLRCLQAATALVFAYLCAGELLPLPVLKVARERVCLQDWQRQQVVLLALLSCLAVLASLVPRGGSRGVDDSSLYTSRVLVAMNVVPVVAAAATTPWIVTSEYCVGRGEGCNGLTMLLDALGLVSAKLARLDLGVSFLLATRGKSAWLFGATGGSLGAAETISLHRTAGWWCARQSALHSAAYLLYYLHEGGARLLWLRCFPVPAPGGNPVNRLGLINGFGVLACLPAFVLTLSALSSVRRTHYHVFQRLHLPLALAFATCCALHDLQILLFAAPGLADWYLGRRDEAMPARLRAQARTLSGTSGPWIELKMEHDETIAARMAECAPRGRWASIRVASLGNESHPLSVASVAEGEEDEDTAAAAAAGPRRGSLSSSFSAIVSANSGDWSRALAALARGDDHAHAAGGDNKNYDYSSSSWTECDVEVSGPFPVGGGGWSLPGATTTTTTARVARKKSSPPRVFDLRRTATEVEPAPALLLIAGGTGITGWLPAMEAAAAASIASAASVASASPASGSGCRLVWCVKTEADYLALASRLPPRATSMKKGSDSHSWVVRYDGVDVSVFITRSDKTASDTVDREAVERSNEDLHHRAVEEEEKGMGLGRRRMASANFHSSSRVVDAPCRDGDSCASSSAFDAVPLVSLGVALLGLFVQHWVWWGWLMLDYKTTIFGSPRTMLGYAVVIRALPVALVVGSMVAATAIGLRAVRALRMMQGSCTSWYRFGTKKDVKKGYIKFSEEDSGGDEAAGDGGNGGGGALDEEQGGTVGVDDVGLYLSEQAGAGLDKEGGASQSFLEEEHSLLRTVEFEDVLSDNPEIGGPRDYEHDVRVGRPNIEALVKAAVAGMKQERPPTTGQRRRLVVAACGPSEMVETARKAVADCRRSCRCEHVRVEFSGAEWQW